MKLISIVIPYLRKNQELQLWGQQRISSDELNGLWEFPGGKVDSDESLEQAAVREVKEEVGIELDTDQLELLGRYVFNPLVINVFLFHDQFQKFSREGYKKLADMKTELELLPPNNKLIIMDISKRFQ